MAEQGHAVIVVAEGAGEDLLGKSAEVDAGGNRKLPPIGEFMKKQIVDYFAKHGMEATVKYIDPSYMIRYVSLYSVCAMLVMRVSNGVSVLQLCAGQRLRLSLLHAAGAERRARSHGWIHRFFHG